MNYELFILKFYAELNAEPVEVCRSMSKHIFSKIDSF
jgi:hypothetical protein